VRVSLARRRSEREARGRRLRDSAKARRRLGIAGLVLLVLGIGVLGFGVYAGRATPPPPVQLVGEGVTDVPRTHFYQNPWVLFGAVDDPRRPPTTEEVGCVPASGLTLPRQPEDPTTLGSRVVEGVPISAIAVFGRSGSEASIRCTGAADYEPLWLMPSTEAPPLTSTSLIIAGVLLLVFAALTHPATIDRPTQWWAERSRRRRTARSERAARSAR
jgi:hypothetical protein